MFKSALPGSSKWRPYAIMMLCVIAYGCCFVHAFIRFGDEGTLTNGAVRVMRGQVPFRDFFEVMGPGTFYWLAIFFKLFGTTWAATRIAMVFTLVATTMLLYHLSRRLGSTIAVAPPIFFIAVSFPYWLMTTHHSVSNLFALLSFTIFISGIDKRRRLLLFIAGLLAGVTTCIMQPKGLLLLLSFTVVLWTLRRTSRFIADAGYLVAGYAGVGALATLLFAIAGALPDLIYANIIWPLTNYSALNLVPYGFGFRQYYWDAWRMSSASVLPPAAGVILSVALGLPFAVVIVFPLLLVAYGIWRKSLAFGTVLLPYWICGSALWASELHRKDIWHLVYGSPLLIVLAFHLYGSISRNTGVHAVKFISACAGFLAVFNCLVVQTMQAKVVTPRGIISMAKHDPALDFLTSHVVRGENIFVYPYYPMYYFLSAANNPTRFSILMYGINTDDQFREAVQAIEQSKVRYVLWDTVVDGNKLKAWFPRYENPPQDKLIMEPYLEAHYHVIGIKNGFRILERNDCKLEQVRR